MRGKRRPRTASVTPPAPQTGGGTYLPMTELHTNWGPVERGLMSPGGLRRRAGEPIELEPALAVAPQDARQRWQQDGKLAFQGPGRVDQDQAAAVEAGRIAERRDDQFRAQHFCDAQPAQALGERVRFAAPLDRVPERINAGGPFAVRGGEPTRQAEKIAVLLERRIDQHPAAALLRRHLGAERGPAVDFQRFDADIPAQILPERGGRLRLDLAGDQAVLRAQ